MTLRPHNRLLEEELTISAAENGGSTSVLIIVHAFS